MANPMRWTADPENAPGLFCFGDRISLFQSTAIQWQAEELDFELGVSRAHP